MKAEQVIGVIGMATMTIRPGDTSVAQGVNDLPVVGSNQLLSLMESACSTAIIEFLDFGETTKLAGAGGSKGTNDVAVADKLIKKIDEISEIFWATKK